MHGCFFSPLQVAYVLKVTFPFVFHLKNGNKWAHAFLRISVMLVAVAVLVTGEKNEGL